MLKYKSPAASALPPPSVVGLEFAIWYLSVKLFTLDILLATVLMLVAFDTALLIFDALDTAELMLEALATAAFMLLALLATAVILELLPATAVTLELLFATVVTLDEIPATVVISVSYTHLTLPTKRIV